jgi:hypothetical protein
MKEETQRVIEQGLLAGVLGHITVAIIFAIINLASGRPGLYTPALLGGALFYGVSDPAQLEIRAAYVFAYNGTHLLIFLALGLVGSWLTAIADRGWQLWYLALFFFLFVAFHVFGLVQFLVLPVRESLSDVALWIAGFAATAVMAAFFVARHPGLISRLAHEER